MRSGSSEPKLRKQEARIALVECCEDVAVVLVLRGTKCVDGVLICNSSEAVDVIRKSKYFDELTYVGSSAHDIARGLAAQLGLEALPLSLEKLKYYSEFARRVAKEVKALKLNLQSEQIPAYVT